MKAAREEEGRMSGLLFKESKMGTLKPVVLLFVTACCTTCCYAREPRQATLAQQKMCAEQARKFFLDPEFNHETWTEYTSHYDLKMNVCYVMVRQDIFLDKEHSAKFHSVAFTVFDAFEGVERAAVQTDTSTGKPYACHLKLPGKEEVFCKTENEWDALVLKHFGIEKP